MKTVNHILVLLFFIILSSCSSKKKLVDTPAQPNSVCGIQKDSLSQYFPTLDSAKHDWLKIKGDLKAEFKAKAYEINIQLRVLPNDTLWISLSKASFPLLKMIMTKDSVKAIDLFNKQYLRTDYIGLSKRLGVELNFPLLQNVLLGQYLPLPNADHSWEDNGELTLANLSKKRLNEVSTTLDTTVAFAWSQWISCKTKAISKQYIIIPRNKEELLISSANIDTSTYLSIPKDIEVTAVANKTKKASISLVYKRFKQATTMNVPFNIPDNYVEME